MNESRWVSINGKPLHIMFADNCVYDNGISVQWQDEALNVYGPHQTYYQENKR